MLARVISNATLGIDPYRVEVEIDVSEGKREFNTVGLPDVAVKESRDRVRAAIRNSGYKFPGAHITVNLAPADVRKEGPVFDLPIAVGILATQRVIKPDRLTDHSIVGELSLDGRVNPVAGVLNLALGARQAGLRAIIVPEDNASEAAIVEGIEVIPATSLKQTIKYLNGEIEIKPHRINLQEVFDESSKYREDFSDVKGQEHAKRALEVAAAGGHNVLMIGPPGAGKTMLARRLSTILPPMTMAESIETTRIHSIAGLLSRTNFLLATRPFRAPHHTISNVALIGGGANPRPGEVSLANNGVLFLDEMPEFQRSALESMRQPVEEGYVNIARATMSVTFPSRFILCGAMNPCPCGYLTDPQKQCVCTPAQIQRYVNRISGPLMDRIDIHIEIPPVRAETLTRGRATGKSSACIRERVIAARNRQLERYKNLNSVFCNAHLSSKELTYFCNLTDDAKSLLENAINSMGLSARAYDRIRKVALTIADLEGSDDVQSRHIAEAVQYRSLDRYSWE